MSDTALAVIPPKAVRTSDIPCDFAMYRWRHLIEKFLLRHQELSPGRHRYDKTDQSFTATIHLVAIALALK